VVVRTAGDPVGRPRVVAVDGRGASGKSTLAKRLSAAVPSSVVVSTDDRAWHHSFFGWTVLLAVGVLEPVRRGDAVSYRPLPGGTVDAPGQLRCPSVENCCAQQRPWERACAVVAGTSDSRLGPDQILLAPAPTSG